MIFSREIFYIIIVLCLYSLWLKAVCEITARQTRTSLRKHDVIKVHSIEYLTPHKLNVANFQVMDFLQNYRMFNFGTIV